MTWKYMEFVLDAKIKSNGESNIKSINPWQLQKNGKLVSSLVMSYQHLDVHMHIYMCNYVE